MKIYAASRASLPERAAMWQALRAAGIQIVSTWIDEAGPSQTKNYAELWQRIVREISEADRLVLYAREKDLPLKGALVEVGIALALDKPVFCVLPELINRHFAPSINPEEAKAFGIGSWIAHPNVRMTSLSEAIGTAKEQHGS